MQDFIEQAEKKGIKLLEVGKCQFCGADYQNGIFGCMENYNNGISILDLNSSENNIYRFLSVDSHALQHPEIHGRWSNHFHLTRLNLILEKKQKWDYKTSPLLSDYLNKYKLIKPNEFLIIPKPLERGKITSKELTKTLTKNECIETIKNWANQVYEIWKLNHSLVSDIADGFIIEKAKNK